MTYVIKLLLFMKDIATLSFAGWMKVFAINIVMFYILFFVLKIDPPFFRNFVAMSPFTPPAYLDHLSDDDHIVDDVVLRVLVAGNRTTYKNTLSRLSKDPDSGVRYVVAANPKTPPPYLFNLLKDSDPHVLEKAKKNLKNRGFLKDTVE